jgi:hypothetical protein
MFYEHSVLSELTTSSVINHVQNLAILLYRFWCVQIGDNVTQLFFVFPWKNDPFIQEI